MKIFLKFQILMSLIISPPNRRDAKEGRMREHWANFSDHPFYFIAEFSPRHNSNTSILSFLNLWIDYENSKSFLVTSEIKLGTSENFKTFCMQFTSIYDFVLKT